MRTTGASRQPEQLSSESSDSDREEESLFGPQCSTRSPCKNQPSQRSAVAPWANTNRPCESPITRGSDRELQAFISMRDQADKATEVRESVLLLQMRRRAQETPWEGINTHSQGQNKQTICSYPFTQSGVHSFFLTLTNPWKWNFSLVCDTYQGAELNLGRTQDALFKVPHCYFII